MIRQQFLNLPRLIDAVRALRGIATEELAAAADSGIEEARQAAATYPPELPGQTYVRTYTLEAGWLNAVPDRSITADRVVVELYNPVAYVPLVQGNRSQARVHRGRWDRLGQIARDVAPVLRAELDRALVRIVRRFGGGA